MTALGRALVAADPQVPERFRRFDALIDQSGLVADLEEYSIKLGTERAPYRATHYFDVAKREPGLMRSVLELARQATGCDALLANEHPEDVLQVVLGIDDRGVSTADRQKIYFVLKPSPGRFVRALLAQLSVSVPEKLELDLVYILGLDFAAAGFSETKLYFVLERERVPKVVELSHDAELFSGTRLVVMQHCVSTQRRQIFFHADSPRVVERVLDRYSDDASKERLRGMNAALAPQRMKPWIVAFPLIGHRIDRDACSVYFHVA